MPGLKRAWRPLRALDGRWHAQLDEHIIAIRWAPDGSVVAAARSDGPVVVLDGMTGRPVAEVRGHRVGTCALAWHPDSARLATAGQDGTVRLWRARTGAMEWEAAGGAPWVEHAAWSPSGTYLATAAGRVLRLFLPDGTLHAEVPGHQSTISALEWRPGHDEVTVAGYGGLRRYGPDDPRPIKEYDWKGSVLTIAWSPDSRFIATGDQDSTMHFWIVKTGTPLQMWGYPSKVQQLAWDATSRWLATGGGEHVTVWDCRVTPENTTPLVLAGHGAMLTALAFQRRGGLLASASEDGRCIVWHPEQGERPVAAAAHTVARSAVQWAPSGRLLAVGSADGRVDVYRVES